MDEYEKRLRDATEKLENTYLGSSTGDNYYSDYVLAQKEWEEALDEFKADCLARGYVAGAKRERL